MSGSQGPHGGEEPRPGGEAEVSDPLAAPPTAPATGSDDYWETELVESEEPVVTATLFFVMIILMIIAAFWITIYLRLLDR